MRKLTQNGKHESVFQELDLIEERLSNLEAATSTVRKIAQDREYLRQISRVFAELLPVIRQSQTPQVLLQETCRILHAFHAHRKYWMAALNKDGTLLAFCQVNLETDEQRITESLSTIGTDAAGEWPADALKVFPGNESALYFYMRHDNRCHGVLAVLPASPDSMKPLECETLNGVARLLAMALNGFGLQTQLAEKEKSLKLAIQAAGEGFWEWNQKTKHMSVSPGFYTIMGYEPDTLPVDYQAWKETIHPEDLPQMHGIMTACLLDPKGTSERTVRLRRRDGAWRWMLIRSQAVEWDVLGQPVRIVGTCQDVTERRAMEAELVRSEQKYRFLFDNAGDAIFVISQDGRLLDVNCYACEHYGYSREELLAMTAGVVNANDASELMQKLDTVKAQGHYWSETEHRTKDGRRIPVEVLAKSVEYEGQLCILAFARDITRRKQAEEELRKSTESFRAILDHATDGIFAIDRQGTILEWTRGLEKITGLSREETVGGQAKIWDLMAQLSPRSRGKAAAENFRKHTLDLIDRKSVMQSQTQEILVQSKNGAIRCVRNFIISGDNLIAGILQDITEFKTVKDQLTDSQMRMEVALNGADLVLWEAELSTGRMRLNRHSAEMLGYPLNENNEFVTSREALYPPSYVTRVKEVWQDFFEGRIPRFEMELQLKTVSGDMKWVVARGQVTAYQDGKPARAMGTYHDIDRLKRTEIDLRIKDSAIRSSRNAIAFASLEGRIFYANPAFLEMFGYERVEDLEIGKLAQTPGSVVGSFGELLGNPLEAVEFIARRTDGSVFPVLASSSLVRDDNGQPLCLMGFVQDLSEQKKLHAEMATLRKQEQERIARELHDCLGQDLTGISLLSKALAQTLAAQQRPEADGATKITNLANQAISQIRLLISDYFPSQLVAVGLDVSLRQLSFTLQEQYQVACDFSASRPEIVHDPVTSLQLYFIAKEATHNAVKHGQARHILIRMQEQDGRPLLQVCDDGSGFDPHKTQSKGMGLQIMQHRAHLVNADLTISANTDSRGMTVACLLPEPRKGKTR